MVLRTLRVRSARYFKENADYVGAYPQGIQRAIEVLQEKPDEIDPEVKAEILRRVRMLLEAKMSPELQVAYRERAKADISWWMNNFAWTYDPRRVPATLPFNLWPKQEEYLAWRRSQTLLKEGGIVEKSRDVGASWLNVADHVHHWLFDQGYKGTFGTRKEHFCDRIGDPDSLLEKARILIRNLPVWLKPDIWTGGFLKIVNHSNGATITGESGTEMGRGGRSSIYDWDEAAFTPQQERVDAAVSQNTNVIFRCSTPNGPANDYAKKRKSGRFKVFTFHKKFDPRVDDAWFERQRAILEPWIFAQEVDIDYNASVEGIMIPASWVRAAVNYPIDPFGPVQAGLDVADEGEDLNVLTIRQGPVVHRILHRSQGNTTQTAWWAHGLCLEHGASTLVYDSVGVGAGVGGTLVTKGQSDGLPFDLLPFVGGIFDREKEWAEFNNRQTKEIFKNLRSQSWWLMRLRFEKTFEVVNGIRSWPPEELISIPEHDELIGQLSTPKLMFDTEGRIILESKKQLKARGTKSPDYADSLVMAFYQPPAKKKRGTWIRDV